MTFLEILRGESQMKFGCDLIIPGYTRVQVAYVRDPKGRD